MKRVLSLCILAGFLTVACNKKNPPEEPVDKKELLLGTWASQSFRIELTVNGKTVPAFDSVTTGTNLRFTENFNYFGYIDTLKMDNFELADTARYNLKDDTIFLIRNALAYDTLLLHTLNESELALLTDFFQQSIGGQLVSRQTVVSFQRVSGGE